ncbi:MAG: radical SAM protein [Acidobacteria bacterium]|nr:radical SAM protein [Acidobacteriota bacterium]
MMEKLSRYNHFFQMVDTFRVVYNALSGAVVRMTPQHFDPLIEQGRSGEWQKLPGSVLGMLREGGMLVPGDMDELQKVRDRYREKRRATNTLSLTIAPTLDCNFACPYCYESRKPGKMDRKTRNQLLDFTRDKLETGGKLSVTWYGGEPLLVPDVVITLTNEMRKLASKKAATTDFSMVTNGYLLARPIAEKLSAAGVREVQVTLDGPPEIHDTRRKLRDGGATFTVILENLKNAVDLFETVRVRVNLDLENRHAWKRVKEILKEAKLLQHVKLSPGMVEVVSDTDASYRDACMDAGRFSDVLVNWMLESYHEGRRDALKLPRMPVCGAVSENAFVVSPDGALTKCWNDVGNPGKAIGHVSNPHGFNGNSEKWKNFNPVDWPECRDCDMLPICMGDCPDRLMRLGPGPACTRWKHCLREAVILHTLSRIKEEKHGKTG